MVRYSLTETGSLAWRSEKKKSISMVGSLRVSRSGCGGLRAGSRGAPRQVQAVLQVALHRRPFAGDDGEHHGIAQRTVGHALVVAQHAVLLGAKPGDGGP